MTTPGIPPLTTPLHFVTNVLAVADAVSAILGFGTPQWGIFDQSNNPVIAADSVVAVDYKQGWHIADYPIEDGDFASYNKVATPFDAKVTFTQGGTESDRAAFLAAIEAAAASLALYNVVTPEKTYLNANIEHYDYRRTSRNGVGLLMVDVGLVEIRQVATTTFTQTAQPSGADQVNGGTVQAITPTPTQQSAASSLLN